MRLSLRIRKDLVLRELTMALLSYYCMRGVVVVVVAFERINFDRLLIMLVALGIEAVIG